MNRNQKEKLSRMELRVKPKDKKRIQRISKQCGLSVSEYVLQRALGYTPKAVQPDAFFQFYRALCDLLNQPLSHETEKTALKLFDKIHAELIAGKRQSTKEIVMEVRQWQPPDSGPSKVGSGK